MHRPVTSLCLSSSVKLKLVSASFQFTADLLHLQPAELKAGLSQQEALQVLQAARTDAAGGGVTALELLQKEAELKSIVTFCSHLDKALRGGIPVGKTTELCGAPGVGKTQLCLQLAVDVQVPQCFGGVEGHVIYVDTEGGFLHCSLLAEDEEQRVAMETFTVETILSNIYVVRCRDYEELLAELHLLPDFLSERPKVRLLVIDSVASPFQQLFDELSQRTRLLNSLAQRLIAMATSHHIAVVITNKMTTRLRSGQSQLVPALGENWGHAPTIRLLLHWEGPRRLVTIFKSPGHMDATVQYQITADGFRDTDQSEQPQSKRRHTQVDQSAASC
uniref:DNA repair protein RAD51 homolog 3 n=1 Tax=Amphiprion percula TaxID=161767 RepID=A0A3P8UD77_AMPPE